MTLRSILGALTDGLQHSALDLGTVVDDGAVRIVVAGGDPRTSVSRSTSSAAADVRGRHDDVRLVDVGGAPALPRAAESRDVHSPAIKYSRHFLMYT